MSFRRRRMLDRPCTPLRPRLTGRDSRGGFTLLEVLIATAVTLLMMVSLAKIFNIIGDSMQKGRASLELNNDLRDVALRIQNDLKNATANISPPADPALGNGYFKYYDGPLTDYSFAMYSAFLNGDADPLNDVEDLSRYGDADDVLMFTARASGGTWYTGKVPLFVLQGVAPVTDPTDPAYNLDSTTIASQDAEIVIFAEPVVSFAGNPNQLPGPLVADPNNYEVISGTDVPARYRLYYRTLLIRPDLNLPAGNLPSDGSTWLIAQPSSVDPDGSSQPLPPVALPSPTCDMALAHTQCDLSLRRITPANPSAGVTTSFIAANSLSDLVDPANRFAHVELPFGATRSMPILALSPKITMPHMAYEAGSPTAAVPLRFQSGFLHPAFTLYANGRVGEDILASNLLAFDVKGFDPGVPIIATVGADGVNGNAGDDNGNGAVDELAELGWEGSDDQILSPNDPGYAQFLGTGTLVGTGAYVDLGWGWKTSTHFITYQAAAVPGGANLFSELSGLGALLGTPFPFTDALYRSGQALHVGTPSPGTPPLILQHSFDTWSDQYEGDGLLQGELAVAGRRGTVRILDESSSGPALRDDNTVPGGWRGLPGSRIIDAGRNGIDDNPEPPTSPFRVTGIDDLSELETRPPYASNMRGVQVTIRMEDPATKQFNQTSISREFVTNQ